MQQRTSILPAQHPVRALEGLSKQIALPHEYGPQRFPSFPALERTAVMGFNAPVQVDLPTGDSTKFIIARQAAWPVWAEQSFSVLQAYQVVYASSTIVSTSVTQQDYRIDTVVNAQVATATNTTASRLVGVPSPATFPLDYPIVGVDSLAGPVAWTYVPPGATLTVVVGNVLNQALTSSTTYAVNFDIWTGPGESGKLTITTASASGARSSTSGSQAFSFDAGFWVRPVTVAFNAATAYTAPEQVCVGCVVSSQAPTGLSSANALTLGALTFAASTASRLLLPLVQPAEFANSTLPWRAARTTAASLLLTNVSQVLNKAGTVLAGRVSPNVLSPWEVSEAYINNLHPAEKAFLPLETGFYTYVPPSTDLQNFWDYQLVRSPVGGIGTVALDIPSRDIPVYRLDNDALVNIAFLRPGAVAEQVAANVDWHIEFRTSSALFPVGLSAMTLETLHQAQVALAMSGFFFENNKHKQLLGKITSAVKSVAPAIMPVVAKAAKVHPGAAAALHVGKAVYQLSRKNKPTPPATSGAASGIVGKGKHDKKKKKK